MNWIKEGAYGTAVFALLLFRIDPAWATPTVSVTTTDGIYDSVGFEILDVGLTGAQVYNYRGGNITSGTPVFGTQSNTAILGFSQYENVTSFFSIFDARNDGRGGHVSYTLNGVQGAVTEVIDDPNGLSRPREGFRDTQTGQILNRPQQTFIGDNAEAFFVWSPCCTDGAVIGYSEDRLPDRLAFSLTPDSNGSVANSFVGIDRVLLLSQFANGTYGFLDISGVLRGGAVYFDFNLGGGNGGGGGGGGGGTPVPEPGTLLLSVSGLSALIARKRRSS